MNTLVFLSDKLYAEEVHGSFENLRFSLLSTQIVIHTHFVIVLLKRYMSIFNHKRRKSFFEHFSFLSDKLYAEEVHGSFENLRFSLLSTQIVIHTHFVIVLLKRYMSIFNH
ncbi:hypothetical protein ACQ7CW_00910, partial [Chryseobacterium arthrosphaerae]